MNRNAASGLVHSATFYSGDQEYLDAVLPFIVDGVANDESVHVAVPTANLALLRDALGADGKSVHWADMVEVGRNPARTFPMFAAVLSATAPGRKVRSVAEPCWPGRTPDQFTACLENEALFNLAFADEQLVTLCPYDVVNLPGEVIADARRTHPLIHDGGAVLNSPEYSWRDAFEECNTALASDPSAATYQVGQLTDLATARSFATDRACSFGMADDRIGDLNLIITELATNSLKYTGGGCRVALWERDGNLLCEVRDAGRLKDPLAGRRSPSPHSLGGRGLLLVNALADLVRIHTSETGTTIQVHLSLDLPGGALR